MTRYWVVAPFDSTIPDIWERIWQFDLSQGVISVGWQQLGDTTNYSEDTLRTAIQRAYGSTRSFNMLWDFWHNIQPGDIIVARKGRKRIAGVGTVQRSAFYERNKNLEIAGEEYYYPNHIGVRWEETPRDKEFARIVFGMQTLYEIPESKYRELVGESPENISEAREEGVEDATEFVLEKYLEDFIVSNFVAVFQGRFVLYQDPEENATGQQYGTDVGTIDILAQEPSTDSFVVIELKKGRESDKVVGQTLRYMGWVNENLCRSGQSVKGIIICKDSDSKLSYALKMTNNIIVKYYRIDFKLSDIPSR